MADGFNPSSRGPDRPSTLRDGGLPRHFPNAARWALALVALTPLAGCAPKLNAGDWECSADGGPPSVPTDPVAIPWSTGFEERFCDYTERGGFCYGDSQYTLATEQVHTGRFSAKFSAIGEGAGSQQTRCVRQGVLPEAAYYGAWYYIPDSPTANGPTLWNLFHFQTPELPHLWDVTLVADSNGDWDLLVYDPMAGKTFRGPDPTPVPIGAWFHIEFFLKRAADDTGALALYQDEALLFEAANLKSDASSLTEWYVGNLATGITPADSTLYVDDVSISATR